MRRFPLVLTLLAACSAPTDEPGGTAPPTRPGPSPLLGEAATSLAGRGLEAQADGPWQIRRIAAAGTGAEGALDDGPTRDDATLLFSAARGETAASGPGKGGPAGGGARPVAEAARETDGAADFGSADSRARRGIRFDRTGEAEGSAPARNAAPLRAGSTDDNADHDAFCDWLDGLAESGRLEGRYLPMDVRDRRAIRVVDASGDPIPGAEVTIVDENGDRVAWRGTTYGDGRVPFFPDLATPEGSEPPATWLLEIRAGDRFLRQHWDARGPECTVQLAGAADPAADDALALDVVFLIDTTGSMGDEIERIKQTLKGVTDKLDGLDREFSLRYGAVLYRDITDRYVTAAHPFTADLGEFADGLQKIEASGGGDSPESLNQGLAVAVDEMAWRDRAARLVFLIADAPPHLDYEDDVPYPVSCQRAVARGIKIHAVAASGLEEAGSAVFRQVAHLTRGRFIFIEYGGDVAASGEAHGVEGARKSNNLDDILFEQIRDEIAGWGRS